VKPVKIARLNTMSTSGSSTVPSRVIWFQRRASHPSTTSVAAATRKKANASLKWRSSRNSEIPGTSVMRSSVSTVGKLSAERRKPSRSRSMPMWSVTSVKVGTIQKAVLRKNSWARWRS